LVWMLKIRAWTGGPVTHHSRQPSGLFSEWRQGQCNFQWLLLKRWQCLRVGQDCLPLCSPVDTHV
jgi:hypothetical protein